MWGILETKAKFIGQVMTHENHVRRIEDLDAPALTYAEVKAIASGIGEAIQPENRLSTQEKTTIRRNRGLKVS